MSPILNRDFQHPSDGWYMIEPLGDHPNRSAGVVQVIDETAADSIVRSFNSQADAQGSAFPGMLVDHEHFSHRPDQETRAFGWLNRLDNRGDGIYGQIRWSSTGRQAVDGGDYRFFSTEYDLRDAQALNREDAPARVRPLRLAGLTLTNKPNNKGGKPITNREPNLAVPAGAGAASPTDTTKTRHMQIVANKLGLAAEASEDAILAAVTQIMNRATDAENKLHPLQDRIKLLEAADLKNRESQADADLEAVRSKLAPEELGQIRAQLVANREAALPLLKLVRNADAGCAPGDTTCPKCGHSFTVKNRASAPLAINREAAKTPGNASVDRSLAINREVHAFKAIHNCSFERAWSAVRAAKPDLFQADQ